MMKTLSSGPEMTRAVMRTSTASRPDVVDTSDGRVTAAQQRIARHRPHATTVTMDITTDMIADSTRLHRKQDVMYSSKMKPTNRPANTDINQ